MNFKGIPNTEAEHKKALDDATAQLAPFYERAKIR